MFTNAITWANVRLRGGWKSYAITAGGYAALLALVYSYISRMGAAGTGSLPFFSTILFFIQLLILIFLGCTSIGNAIRRDVGNGLIASHRLMPVSPSAAVFGYIVGPATMALSLAAVNLVAGAAAAAAAGIDLAQWGVANALLFMFVVFLWVGVAFMAFISKNAFGGLFGLLFGSVSGGGFIIAFVPALAVLLSPVMVIFGSAMFRGGVSARLTPGYGYAVLAQLAFGAILFTAAMRRYRRDDVPALGTLLAFLLLGAWVLTSAVGVLRSEDFALSMAPRRRGGAPEIDVATQSLAAIISSLLMAVAAVSASAKASTEWLRNTITTGHADHRHRPVPPPVLVLLATAIITTLAVGLRPLDAAGLRHLTSAATLSFAARVAAVVAAYLLAISYLLRIVYRVSNKPIIILLLWTVLAWLIPLGADAARRAYAPPGPEPEAFFSRMSPIGELYELWRDPTRVALLGLAVQLALAAIPATLFHATEPRGKPSSALGTT